MPFPWVTIVRWVLPELISTVRNIKKQQAAPSSPHEDDLTSRIEKLEKALELQSRINEELSTQVQQVQKRLQIAMAVGIFATIIAVGTLAAVIWR